MKTNVFTCGIGGMFSEYPEVTMEEIVEYCSTKKILSVDTETEGLDFLTKKIIMFQIGDLEKQFIIDTRQISIEPLRNILESNEILKIIHNVKFDYKFIKKCEIELENVWDTMLVEQVLTTGKQDIKYGLVHVLSTYSDFEIDKSTRNQFVNLGGLPFTHTQIEYGAGDIIAPILIYQGQIEKVQLLNLQKVVDLENEASLAFADIEYNGIGFDSIPWLGLSQEAGLEMVKIGKKLDAWVLKDTKLSEFVASSFQTDLFTPDEEVRKVDIKWTSPTQVLPVFQAYGLDIESVGYFDLMKFKDEFVKLYLEYKKKQKLSTSYGHKFLTNVKADGRIHTSFYQILETGRVSSSKPNMQQIPGTNQYRNCFVSGYKDWVYVSSDYSSQELNVIAFGSKDPTWLQALREGKDLHSVCAELVYKNKWKESAGEDCAFYAHTTEGTIAKEKCDCKEHKKLRTGIKTINFGLAYGMSAFKLADTLQISVEEAEILITEYFEAFPSIKNFLDQLGAYGVKNGFIMTFAPYRRRRWFPEFSSSMDFKTKGNIERQSKNMPIQGSSADMTKHALALMRTEIKSKKLPVKLVMTVHDQIDTICEKSYAETWKVRMTELMEKAALVVVTNGLLKAETEITTSWSK